MYSCTITYYVFSQKPRHMCKNQSAMTLIPLTGEVNNDIDNCVPVAPVKGAFIY